MKGMIDGQVPVLHGRKLVSTAIVDGRVRLELRSATGDISCVSADHVVAATGYRVDIQRLTYLDESLVLRLAHVNQAPRLSTCFGSSIEGLFLAGPVAANSFGPMMRFAVRAGFASRRLVPLLSRLTRAHSQIRRKQQLDAGAER